jgi:hypothetical protein
MKLFWKEDKTCWLQNTGNWSDAKPIKIGCETVSRNTLKSK